jgi:hypothetical protein
MGAPQIIYIVLTALGLLLVAEKHGKVPEKPENLWTSLFATAIVVGLLIWGGFFS